MKVMNRRKYLYKLYLVYLNVNYFIANKNYLNKTQFIIFVNLYYEVFSLAFLVFSSNCTCLFQL